ncbi:MAG: uroporphyrinogen decarboxylase family protein [Promethearchaeota archaeon]
MEYTSEERVWAALNHEVPDRVPTHAVAIDGAMANEVLGGVSKSHFDLMAEFRAADPDGWAEKFNSMLSDLESSVFGRALEAAAALGFDACGAGYIPFVFKSEGEMQDVFGRVYRIQNNHGNIFPFYYDGLIKTEEDWKNWPRPDVKKICRKAKSLYKSVRRRVRGKIEVVAQDDYTSVFPPVWQGMGMGAFARALRKNSPMIEERFDFTTDLVVALFRTYHEAGARVFFEGGDIAFKSGPMISPKHIEKYWMPRMKRLTGEVHDWGGKIIFHSDGDVVPILDYVVEAGFDALHCLEPPLVDPALVKKKVGDKLCLLGNIDTSHVLVAGTRQEVRDAVRAAIRALAPGGGYILSPSNDHPAITVKHYRWMLEAAREFGGYPLVL